MKISELIEVLHRRLTKHGDREVEVTWETITVQIRPRDIYLSTWGVLLIDADQSDGDDVDHHYKSAFAADPNEQ